MALRSLKSLDPPWTLTGGGALVLAYLGHRTTRDLDLFFRGCSDLGPIPAEAERLLNGAGGTARILRRYPTFAQLRVETSGDVTTIDLVATPGPNVEPAVLIEVAGETVQADSPHEILVNKLCALLSRSEVRDLFDIRALVAAGQDLERALGDAPIKDAGFSPLTAAWLLKSLDLKAAAATGLVDEDLARFRDRLVERLASAADPTPGA